MAPRRRSGSAMSPPGAGETHGVAEQAEGAARLAEARKRALFLLDLRRAVDADEIFHRLGDELRIGEEQVGGLRVQQVRHVLVLLQILHDEAVVEHLLVQRQVFRVAGVAARLDLEDRLAGDAAGGHGEVGALAMHGVVELRGVAADHIAVAEQFGDRLVAAFRDEMRGIFLDLGAGDQRRHRRMLLEQVEQLRRRGLVLGEIRHQAAQADRNAFLVGVDEAHAGHSLGNGSGGLDHHAFVALDVEALLDHLGGQEVHFLHRQRDLRGLRARAQFGARAEQAVDAFREHHDIGVDGAAGAVGAHADHLAVGVLDQLHRGGLAQQDHAFRARLLREPAVELRADDGVAVALLLVEVVVAVMHAGMGGVRHQPEALLDQVALQRRLVAEVRDDLLDHVRIENAALHVLRAGIFAALQLQHFQPARGHGVGRRVAGHAGADDDRVKFLVDHVVSFSRPAGLWNGGTGACGKLR